MRFKLFPTNSGGASSKRPWHEAAVVVLLLALYVGLAVSAVWDKSATFDEVLHLTKGYSFWQTGDFQFFPENGLPQQWAALALLPGHWEFPPLGERAWSEQTVWQVGKFFFFRSGNDADALLFRGRMMIVVLGVALGLLVYAWSRRLFGPAGGLISLTLYATCPTVLAHGALVTADLAAALFFTASAWSLWVVLHRITPLTLAASALALSCLFLSKMSAVLILPVGVLLAALRLLSARPLTIAWPGGEWVVRTRGGRALATVGLLLGHVVILWAAIWAFCGFRYSAVRSDRAGCDSEYRRWWPMVLAHPGLPMKAVAFAREHQLLPEAYLCNFAHRVYSDEQRLAFFNGQHSAHGWPLYFPYCLLVKTPLALFALLGVAAGAGIARARRAGDGRALAYQTAPLWILLAVYWAFAIASHLNIGQRHLLPTYPAMYILAGAAALWLRQSTSTTDSVRWPGRRGWSIGIALLLGLAVVESLTTWPHYLSYFNLFAGGPRNGYKHLVDSSLDWGQDLRGVKRWLDDHDLPDGERRAYLAYFGSAVPEYYGIDATLLPCYLQPGPDAIEPASLSGGVYCISATMLQGVYLRNGSFRGPWERDQEALYQKVQAIWEESQLARDDPDTLDKLLRQTGKENWHEFVQLYEEARFARLCAYLRQREPDDYVGYSILIYQLSEADVHRALHGPAP